jgi:hypothetical protein
MNDIDNAELFELYGPVIHAYTRADALSDGDLVDVTAQASSGPDGMMGGFTLPVALTRALWGTIENIPTESVADVRDRLHDVLWLARATAVQTPRGSRVPFQVFLPSRGTRTRNRQLVLDIGPGDDGAPVLTIGFPEDF